MNFHVVLSGTKSFLACGARALPLSLSRVDAPKDAKGACPRVENDQLPSTFDPLCNTRDSLVESFHAFFLSLLPSLVCFNAFFFDVADAVAFTRLVFPKARSSAASAFGFARLFGAQLGSRNRAEGYISSERKHVAVFRNYNVDFIALLSNEVG